MTGFKVGDIAYLGNKKVVVCQINFSNADSSTVDVKDHVTGKIVTHVLPEGLKRYKKPYIFRSKRPTRGER